MDSRQNYIRDIFKVFKKVQLKDIILFFGGPSCPYDRKDEILDKLSGHIAGNPEDWLTRMLERDLRLLKKLTDAGPDVPLYLEETDYPSMLEALGLIERSFIPSNLRKIWLPKEIYDIVAPHIDKALEAGETSGRFDIERVVIGYLNLYGVLPFRELCNKMLDYGRNHQKKMDMMDFIDAFFMSPILKISRFERNGKSYVCTPSIMDPDMVLEDRREYSFVKGYNKFGYRQALEAGSNPPYCVYGMETAEGKAVADMLSDLGFSSEEVRIEMHAIWINAQMLYEDSTELLFRAIDRKWFVVEKKGRYEKCMHVIADYANILPKWLLKGYSSNQKNALKMILRSDDEEDFSEQAAPLDEMIRKNPLLGMFVTPTPPDAPCPCGSGFSYRNCHGRLKN